MQISNKRKIVLSVSAVIGVLVVALLTLVGLYFYELRPVNPDDTTVQTITIQPGSTPRDIAQELEDQGLIRNKTAFSVYTTINRVAGSLQAGRHNIAPSYSTPEVVAKLQQSETEDIVVTFVPGAMLRDNSSADEDRKQDVFSVLTRLGYGEAEIEQAFQADYSEYNDTLFQGRPATAGIEGYVYGETYHVEPTATVEQILRRTFDEFWRHVEENQLVEKFAEQDMTLFEGITLASIVQKEVSCQGSQMCDDQRQVSQVFHRRLDIGMSLGADATFMYAAAQAGQVPTVDFDSPYNTRVHQGLTPGPISSPGLGALLATADPAEGDFLFFVSGDDGVNYFARTEAEHVENTRRHCDVNCRLPVE